MPQKILDGVSVPSVRRMMTQRYRESASLKVRGKRGGAGGTASGGSVTKKQKRSGPGLPVFSCLGYTPRHNKSLARTPGTTRHVSRYFCGRRRPPHTCSFI